jgi:hypothetical protein
MKKRKRGTDTPQMRSFPLRSAMDVPMEAAEEGTNTITLHGLGNTQFYDTQAQWTKGHLHTQVWNFLTQHHQQKEQTRGKLMPAEANILAIQQFIPAEAIILAIRAANIICNVPGDDRGLIIFTQPRSIIEFLLGAPLTHDQLKNMQDQIVRHDGVLTLKRGFHWSWQAAQY